MFHRLCSQWRTAGIAFLLGGITVSVVEYSSGDLNADTRRATPTAADQHFKSGGRLAENVLQEILVVLKRMDERQARMEAGGKTAGRANVTAGASADLPETSPNKFPPEIKVRRGS